MVEVIDLKVLEDFNIWLKFSDGIEKVVNFKSFLGKGFTKDLLTESNFRKVNLEEGGGIAWYNGYDFCPNYLRYDL